MKNIKNQIWCLATFENIKNLHIYLMSELCCIVVNELLSSLVSPPDDFSAILERHASTDPHLLCHKKSIQHKRDILFTETLFYAEDIGACRWNYIFPFVT